MCRLPLVATSRGYSLVVVCGFLILVASQLGRMGSRTRAQQLLLRGLLVAHRLRYSAAHRIFLDQGLNPSLLHWQVDS